MLKALGRDEYDLLGGDLDPYAAGLYLVPQDRRFLLPRGDAPGFDGFVLDLCGRAGIDVLIPTVDSELVPLARRRRELGAAGTRLVLADEATLACCLDKWELYLTCSGTVNVPGTSLVDDGFDPSSVAIPSIVKPRSGSGSRGVAILRSREEVERLPRDGSLLVQDFLPGTEYSLDVLARPDGEVVAVVPRARLKIDSGIAVTARTVISERLDAIGRAVAARIGLTAIANVQVKEDARGEPALLEVNPRFPGTMSLTVAAGINMPRLSVEAALGTPIPAGRLPFIELGMARYLEETFFATEELQRSEAARLALGDGVVPDD